MILFSFYPTSPATTVQEIAQWRNLYLVIIYKVSSLKLCIFNFSALSVSYISSMAVRRKCTCFQQVIFLWIFQCKWKFRSCEALFIEVPLTQAQVSPGVTHNSLRGMSVQAILLGMPLPKPSVIVLNFALLAKSENKFWLTRSVSNGTISFRIHSPKNPDLHFADWDFSNYTFNFCQLFQ